MKKRPAQTLRGRRTGHKGGICDAKVITARRTVRAAVCLGARATRSGGEPRSAVVADSLGVVALVPQVILKLREERRLAA
jgi:hypothetical protein